MLQYVTATIRADLAATFPAQLEVSVLISRMYTKMLTIVKHQVTQSGTASDAVIVSKTHKFKFKRLTTVRVVLPEERLCSSLVPGCCTTTDSMALFSESMEVQDPQTRTPHLCKLLFW